MGYGFRLIFLKPCRTFLSVASGYKSQFLMFLMLFPLIKEEVGGLYSAGSFGLRYHWFTQVYFLDMQICACLQFLATTSLIFPSFEAVFGLLDHVFEGFTGGKENGS